MLHDHRPSHKNRRKLFASACFALLLGGVAPAVQAQRSADPLRPLVQCVQDGGLKTLEVTRLPEQITNRRVETGQGPQRVSLADGYRLLLSVDGKVPVLNVKIERSRPESFDADRDVLRQQMDYFVSRAPSVIRVRDEEHKGLTVLALKRPDIIATGPTGIATLINPATRVVTTANFLDDASANAAMNTLITCTALTPTD
jgi:hypothetical protein